MQSAQGSASTSSTPSGSLPAFLRAAASNSAGDAATSAAPSQLRLQALYASTAAQRSANPTGYSANAAWWADALESGLRSGYINANGASSSSSGKAAGDAAAAVMADRLVLKVDDGLLARLEWEGRRPRGIGGFVERLATASPPVLHPLPHFLSSATPLHAPASLTYRLVGRPLWWAVSQLNPFGTSGSGSSEVSEEVLWKKYGKGKEYVHMPLLEQAAAAFTAHMRENPLLSYSSSLYDLASFVETFGEICLPGGTQCTDKTAEGRRHRLSKRDCELLLRWLSRDCGVIVWDGAVVKILDEGEPAAGHEITEADKGTLAILQTLKKVDAQVSAIEQQINTCQDKAKAHLSKSQRSLAMSWLRSKKALEDLLDKRLGVADQLRGVLRSIDQARGDVEIMEAYETSTSTLAKILANPKLDAEYIASTTDALADTLADAHEIDEAIQVGGRVAVGAAGNAAGYDDDELAGELDELVKEERERSERERVDELQRAAAKQREREQKDKAAAAATATAAAAAAEADTDADKTQKANDKGSSAIKETGTSAEWQKRYDDSQQRDKEEKARAEVERMKRDEARMVAE